MLKRFWGWVMGREQDLFIDLRRVNDEDRKAHHLGLEEDVEYRTRVKKRMIEGLTARQMAPLYVKPSKRHRAPRNVLPMPKAEVR